MLRSVVILLLATVCLAHEVGDFGAADEFGRNEFDRSQAEQDETTDLEETGRTEAEEADAVKDEADDEEEEFENDTESNEIEEDASINRHVRYLDATRAALLKFAANLRKGKNVTNAFLKVIDGFEKKIADYQASLGRRRVNPALIKKVEKFIKEASKDRKANTKVLRQLTAEGVFLAEKSGRRGIAKRDDRFLLSGALAFLESIREDIGDNAFDDFLSVSGLVTLMFVIDDTLSMSGEIKSAIAIATQIVRAPRDYKVDYILSPFNDPTTGPITVKKEDEGEAFVIALRGLRVHGGGDCPELAFKGMINALDSGPQIGSSMYVFTDASPKDATKDNVNTVLDRAHDLDVYINFFTTGNCHKPKASAVYNKIAEETGGLVYPLKSSAEIINLGKLVAGSLRGSAAIGSGGSGKKTGRRRRATGSEYSINVDDSIEKLLITVTTQKSGVGITLLDPKGKAVTKGRSQLSRGAVYEIANPVAGVYKLIVPVSAGVHKYRVNAVSGTNVDFGHYYAFVPKRGRNPVPVPLEQPLLGFSTTVFITVAGAESVRSRSLFIKVVRKTGTVHVDKPLTPVGTSGVRYVAKFKPPSGPFKLELHGKTKKGNAFVRTSAREDQATPVVLRLSYKPDTNILVRSKTKRLTIQIRRGKVGHLLERYTMSVKDPRGYGRIARQPRPVRRGRFGFAYVYLEVPADAPKGKTVVLEIYLTKKGDRKPSASLKLSLLIV